MLLVSSGSVNKPTNQNFTKKRGNSKIPFLEPLVAYGIIGFLFSRTFQIRNIRVSLMLGVIEAEWLKEGSKNRS
jgi:hypothetical protein